MLGRCVDRDQPEWRRATVDDVVSSSGRNEHEVALVKGANFTVEHGVAGSVDEDEDLVGVRVDLGADVLADGQAS